MSLRRVNDGEKAADVDGHKNGRDGEERISWMRGIAIIPKDGRLNVSQKKARICPV